VEVIISAREVLGAYNSDYDTQVTVPLVQVRTPAGDVTHLHLHRQFPNGARSVDVTLTLMLAHGDRLPLEIPAICPEQLSGHLTYGLPTASFGSYHFAYYMNGRAVPEEGFRRTDWVLSPISTDSPPRVGDTIAVGASETDLRLFGVYLGHGKVLLKGGLQG